MGLILLNTPKISQGPAKIADAEDLLRDENGFTNPNLHRRVETTPPVSPQVFSTTYTIEIESTNSYRTTQQYFHDEESTISEIP